MTSGGVSIERVRVKDLLTFARGVLSQPERFPIAPLTLSRAEAHVRNPAADPEEIGLLVAYSQGRCCGYLGLLPIGLDDRGRHVKVDCLSTLYVAPQERQTGAGALLVLQAMSLGKDLIAVGTSEAATRLLLALGFARAGPLRCLTIRIEALLPPSFALGALGRRLEGSVLRRFRVLLDAPRAVLRGSLDVVLRRTLARLPGRLRREGCRGVIERPTARVASPGVGIAPSPLSGPRFVRDDETVNWMIACPWILEGGVRQADYAFSSRREVFRYLAYGFRGGTPEENLGYVVLSVSSQEGRTTIKLLDHALSHERLRACAFALALREAARFSADVLECADAWRDLVEASRVLRSVTTPSDRVYLVHTRDPGGPLGTRRSALVVGYCDGEAPYT